MFEYKIQSFFLNKNYSFSININSFQIAPPLTVSSEVSFLMTKTLNGILEIKEIKKKDKKNVPFSGFFFCDYKSDVVLNESIIKSKNIKLKILKVITVLKPFGGMINIVLKVDGKFRFKNKFLNLNKIVLYLPCGFFDNFQEEIHVPNIFTPVESELTNSSSITTGVLKKKKKQQTTEKNERKQILSLMNRVSKVDNDYLFKVAIPKKLFEESAGDIMTKEDYRYYLTHVKQRINKIKIKFFDRVKGFCIYPNTWPRKQLFRKLFGNRPRKPRVTRRTFFPYTLIFLMTLKDPELIALLAQWKEQWSSKPKAEGSSPSECTVDMSQVIYSSFCGRIPPPVKN